MAMGYGFASFEDGRDDEGESADREPSSEEDADGNHLIFLLDYFVIEAGINICFEVIGAFHREHNENGGREEESESDAD